MSPGRPEDRSLVRRMLAGHEAAFRFALARVREAPVAEEVVQAALCQAVAKLASYRGEAALLTWLTTFCRHEISAYYARQARIPPRVDLIEELPEVRAALESLSSGAAADPDAAFRREELSRLVQTTLDHLLPPARRRRPLADLPRRGQRLRPSERDLRPSTAEHRPERGTPPRARLHRRRLAAPALVRGPVPILNRAAYV